MVGSPGAALRESVGALRRLILALALTGCASQGPPPGGPVDTTPPVLLNTTPDSGSVNVRPKAVVLQFDEVVNERPSGPQNLAGLVLISPRDGEPRVDWHRRSISIRPRNDWKSNTAYTITLLPGLSDLRNNVRKEQTTIVFSTGPTLPAGKVTGIVFDWVQGRPAARAAVEAIRRPDSTTFVSQADSTGHFVISFLAPGTYTVVAYIDANTNHVRDPREAFDSATVALRDSVTRELLAFVHDSIGPGFTTVDVRDSLTVHATMDRPLDATQPLDSTRVRLRAADSTVIPIASVLSAADFEKRRQAARLDSAQRRDTAARLLPRDTAARSAAPVPSKPVPITELIIQLRTPLKPGTEYRLEAHDLRGLLGTTRPGSRVFTTPRVAPPDTTHRPPADSGRRTPDGRVIRPPTPTRRPP